MSNYFEKWVQRMCNSFFTRSHEFALTVSKGGAKVIIVNRKTGSRGMAKCNMKTDTPNKSIGIAIAYARCIGKRVPDMNYTPKPERSRYRVFKFDKRNKKVLFNDIFTYKDLIANNIIADTKSYLDDIIDKSGAYLSHCNSYTLTIHPYPIL